MNTTPVQHGSTAAAQSTLVTTHLEDLNISDHHGKQGLKPMIHGRKATTYLRVFDDEQENSSGKPRSSSSGAVRDLSGQCDGRGSKALMRASVDQRPALKQTRSGSEISLSESKNKTADDLSLKPKTSASAIYFTSEEHPTFLTDDGAALVQDNMDKSAQNNVITHMIDIEPVSRVLDTEDSSKVVVSDTQVPRAIVNSEDYNDELNKNRAVGPKVISSYENRHLDENVIEDDQEDDQDAEKGDFPLAVELKPFTNKVGGHTAIFKFSERAVCKALVNRENNWYETIEREHQELLQFMPRYIGVLNVRQHFHSKEDFLKELDSTIINTNSNDRNNNNDNNNHKDSSNINTKFSYSNNTNNHRPDGRYDSLGNKATDKIAYSPYSTKMEGIMEEITPLPEVVLDDNKHIIPNSLYHQYSSSRSHSNSPSSAPLDSYLSCHSMSDSATSGINANLGSGATSINTKLQELVLKEAFMKRKTSDSCKSPKLAPIETCSSPSLKECRHSRSSSSSSNKKPKCLAKENFLRRNSMKRGTHSTNNVLDLRNNSVDDDDAIFKLDDDNQVDTHPQDEAKCFDHESVSVEENSHTIVSKFILLEDLTRKLKCPSVLDLKMGTRQYGVDAKASKQLSQREKCKKTTSRKLGVRVCGLKIWDKKEKYYITRDKYFGRRVKVGWQFARVLSRFLYDGESRSSIIKQIPLLVNQLETLYTEISRLKSYRLYGSSLLLFYDGDNPQNKRSRVKVNIIDFARCVTDHDVKSSLEDFKIPPHYPNREDCGFLRGVKSLKFYLLHIWNYLTNDHILIQEEDSLRHYLKGNEKQFNLPWDWLDEYDKENELESNDAKSALRVKWRKYELIFDIEPRYIDEEVSD